MDHNTSKYSELENMVIRLESQLAFQEDRVNQMHELMYAQQQEIFRLQRQVKQLKEKTNTDDAMAQDMLRHEKPPHY